MNWPTSDGNITMKWKNLKTLCQYMTSCLKKSLKKWNIALGFGAVILGRWSWNGHLLVTLEKNFYIHWWGLLGNRASGHYDSFTWKMILKDHSVVAQGKSWVHTSIVQVSWKMKLWVDMIALLGRQSWKDHLLVTQGKTLLSKFIVQVFWETELLEWVCWFERTDFWKFLLLRSVVFLKGLTFDNFNLGGWGGLESTDFRQFTLGEYGGH